MSQLNKTQLEQENQSNFPNNNSGFITPLKLREFNTDMIDSMVTEGTFNSFSQSLSGSIDALELWSASLEITFVTQAELTATQSILQGNIDGKLFTSSFNTFSSSNSATFTNYSASTAAVIASIDAVNDTIFGQFTSSTNAFTQSIKTYTASLNLKTGSFATTGSNNFVEGQSIKTALYVNDILPSGSIGSNTRLQISASRVIIASENEAYVRGIGLIVSGGLLTTPSISEYQTNGGIKIVGKGLLIDNSLIVTGSLTASLPEGYAWVGNSNNKSSLVPTSSFAGGGGTGAGFPFTGSALITGSLGITGSLSVLGKNPTQRSGSFSGSLISNILDTYTSILPAQYVVTIDSSSYGALLAAGTVDPNTLYFVSG